MRHASYLPSNCQQPTQTRPQKDKRKQTRISNYLVKYVSYNLTTFGVIGVTFDYESAALPLSYLGPLKITDLFKTSTYRPSTIHQTFLVLFLTSKPLPT